MTCGALTNRVRAAVHAGRFYPGDPGDLRGRIKTMLGEAPVHNLTPPPEMIVVPHAGYPYSGPTAAAVYRTVQGQTFDRVLIVAPAHTAAIEGVALAPEAAFETPLGSIPVDQRAVCRLAGLPMADIDAGPHATEHAIEVELPFLQVVLGGPFKIVPMVVGEVRPEALEALADEIERIIDESRRAGKRWLIVASSDTYHGYDREACAANDRQLMDFMEKMDVAGFIQANARRQVMACGWKGVALAMMLARRRGARQGVILDHRDSGSALSPEQRAGAGQYVVGYIGAAFVQR